jgi:hypothetical protein
MPDTIDHTRRDGVIARCRLDLAYRVQRPAHAIAHPLGVFQTFGLGRNRYQRRAQPVALGCNPTADKL